MCAVADRGRQPDFLDKPGVGNAAAVVSQDPLDHRDFVRIEAGVRWGDDRLVSMS